MMSLNKHQNLAVSQPSLQKFLGTASMVKMPERQIYNPLFYGLHSYNTNNNPFVKSQIDKPKSRSL